MKLKKVDFKTSDFIKVRDFLKEIYNSKHHHNWRIDRWNFCRFVSQNFQETFDEWPKTVGVWVDEKDEITCVVNSEGENHGEVFFQLKDENYSQENYENFIVHAEEKCYATNDQGSRFIQLRVHPENTLLKDILKKKGYQMIDYKETNLTFELTDRLTYDLDKAFKVVDGYDITPYQKAVAHSKAFGYYYNPDFPIDIPIKAFTALNDAPDYKEALDMAIVNENQEIVSFCTLWYDDYNHIGILEPVGTVPEYRKIGLGKSVIYAGMNRAYALGARKILVGSNQDFYHKIGFKHDYALEIWEKNWTNI